MDGFLTDHDACILGGYPESETKLLMQLAVLAVK